MPTGRLIQEAIYPEGLSLHQGLHSKDVVPCLVLGLQGGINEGCISPYCSVSSSPVTAGARPNGSKTSSHSTVPCSFVHSSNHGPSVTSCRLGLGCRSRCSARRDGASSGVPSFSATSMGSGSVLSVASGAHHWSTSSLAPSTTQCSVATAPPNERLSMAYTLLAQPRHLSIMVAARSDSSGRGVNFGIVATSSCIPIQTAATSVSFAAPWHYSLSGSWPSASLVSEASLLPVHDAKMTLAHALVFTISGMPSMTSHRK